MSVLEQKPLFDEPDQKNWQQSKGKRTCRRDVNAGPGTCYYWWDGCPNAEKRGCYQLWAQRRATLIQKEPGE